MLKLSHFFFFQFDRKMTIDITYFQHIFPEKTLLFKMAAEISRGFVALRKLKLQKE